MKKHLFVLPLILLASCGGGNSSVASGGARRYEKDLTMSNFAEFFESSITATDQSVYAGIVISLKGALSYAYYENVTVTYCMKIKNRYSNAGGSIIDYTGYFKLQANAAGNLYATYKYNELPQGLSPAYPESETSTNVDRSVSVHEISGKVTFRI